MSGGYFYRDDPIDPQGGYVLRADMAKQFSRGSLRLPVAPVTALLWVVRRISGSPSLRKSAIAGEYSLTKRLSGEALASYTDNKYTDASGREDKLTIVRGRSELQVDPLVDDEFALFAPDR